ncbi:MAG: PsbP-related protein [Caulobacteraceae bacterium]
MFRQRLKKIYTVTAFIIIAAFIALILGSRMPAAITAFRENISEKMLSRQLFKTYNALGGAFSFQLPGTWDSNEVAFEGGEIIYHLYFMSKDKKINGFVQVWKLDKTLKQFLDESKKAATGVVDFKFFNQKEIMADNKRGYLLEYSRANEKGEYTRAYEAFIEGYGNSIYRISFFVPEKEWKDYYKILFDRIINSIRIRKPSAGTS